MAISPTTPTAVKPKKQRQWVRENYGRGVNPEAMTKAKKAELENEVPPEGISPT